MSDIRKEFSDTIYPTMVIRSQAETIELQDKEIEKLKELIIALWHNDNARLLNKEQIDLLNNIVFGNDEEDLGSDKE